MVILNSPDVKTLLLSVFLEMFKGGLAFIPKGWVTRDKIEVSSDLGPIYQNRNGFSEGCRHCR